MKNVPPFIENSKHIYLKWRFYHTFSTVPRFSDDSFIHVPLVGCTYKFQGYKRHISVRIIVSGKYEKRKRFVCVYTCVLFYVKT